MPLPPAPRPSTVGIVGAGAVGRALAHGLSRGEFSVALWARDPDAARLALRDSLALPGSHARIAASLDELREGEAGVSCVRDRASVGLAPLP